jgi:hypothetical protein
MVPDTTVTLFPKLMWGVDFKTACIIFYSLLSVKLLPHQRKKKGTTQKRALNAEGGFPE